MDKVDYFSNHALKLRFPWRLYHGPIVGELRHALASTEGHDVLNLGSGPFFELAELAGHGKRFTLCDVDRRALEVASQLHGKALAGVDQVTPGSPLPYVDSRFDAVISMEVIEHVVDPLPWLKEVLRVLRPGGTLFLTTPNYASLTLKALERTVLEVIARAQGFSRDALHPTKLDAAKLSNLLQRVHARNIQTRQISWGWVLAARALR
jgi:SAM-dependent methyltransferase